MQETPDQQWRRLTDYYAGLWDEELLDLAAASDDLTEMARQVLRDEIRKRGLQEYRAPAIPPNVAGVQRKNYDLLAGPLANSYVVPSEPEEAPQAEEAPVEFTWKTILCECNEPVEAQQLYEALKRAGIESWIEAMPPYAIGAFSPRVWVAADQLEQAQAVMARPIPQDILDESKQEIPEFVVPVCPRCRAADPILETAEPVNAWKCEACGNEWSDPAPENVAP